ncbi:FMN-binding protein [Actinomadura scrupuli]|uniref:FMN-binding protein n=1 Tax=Actinomadura scrupuli TaxID=559629 RepID=UPI003D98FDAB
MLRAAVTTSATVAGIILLLSLKPHQVTPAPTATTSSGTTSTAQRKAPSTRPATGTFKGNIVPTRYGPVQVAITMNAGKLTKVTVLRAPNENGRDRAIASFALPQLTDEALSAGTAKIDSVSGATYTSQGYITSLQSALDHARG